MAEEWAAGRSYETTVEKRYWLNDPETMKPVASGRLDELHSIGTQGHLQDFKFGRIIVNHASMNLQLRALAVCLMQDTFYDEITVEIIQPRAPSEFQRTTARYQREHLDMALTEILGLLSMSRDPDAPRIPSLEACRWCKAKAVCPEALSVVHLTTEISPQDLMEWNVLLGLYQKRWKLAVLIHDAIEQHIKQLLREDPSLSTEIGWELSKPATVREILDNAHAARELLELKDPISGQHLISSKELLQIAKFSITKVEKLYRQKTGVMAKDVRGQVEMLLGDAIKFSERSGTLKEVKKK